ncbi:TPA: hypothetical protein ACF0PM_000990 [Clostridium perfringens]|uniref:hypothetical protein n=1 Tax=Clostridium perfringens TaxID=1502 RepID=UPI002AC5C2C4|nr:hypothetical protein [Clostridium perfringens]MDZ4964581.1 hypothetical protein [Clostridium perfringens]MDZ5013095.1 hypothetical protein [Clostridium perfringens]
MTIITDNNYINSSIFTCLIMSIFIYSMGEFSSCYIDEDCMNKVLLSYAISAFIVSISIYIEYFSKGFDLSSSIYVYSAKNSISQVLFTSIIILMFIDLSKSKIKMILRIVVILFEFLLIILLRSRTTIIGFFICIGYIIFGKKVNKNLKILIITIVLITIATLLGNDTLTDKFIYNIIFAGRDFSNIDVLTSGRVSIIKSFPYLIQGHWVTGIGSIYFECFPMSTILNFGLLVGGIVLWVAYIPIFWSIKKNNINKYTKMFFIICIGYFINSFFEGLAPIGPGAKCYFIWLFYGILSKKIDSHRHF